MARGSDQIANCNNAKCRYRFRLGECRRKPERGRDERTGIESYTVFCPKCGHPCPHYRVFNMRARGVPGWTPPAK